MDLLLAGQEARRPRGGERQQAGVQPDDLGTMKLTLTSGETHTIELEQLSLEHRQIFANALIKHAHLVEMDEIDLHRRSTTGTTPPPE